MNSAVGTGTLTRFALRRDRLRTAIWILAIVGLLGSSAPLLDSMFGSEAERQARAAIMRTPTGIVFGGPGYGLDDYTLGPMVVSELLMTLLVALAVMNILLVVRHTRAEEETGRAELIRAGVTGRRAAGLAALIVALVVNAAIGALSAVVLIAVELPVPDSLAIGAGMMLTGLSFAAIAGVCAQIVEGARSAVGLSMLAFGVLFMMRVVGDIAQPGGNALSWLSPLSWTFQTRPYVDLRWWPLLLPLALVVVLTYLAALLASRRDLGAGLIRPRPGAAAAARTLSGALGLHVRQQRGSIITWTVATLMLGLAMGSLADQLADLIQDSPEYQAILGTDAGALTDSFLASIVTYIAMLAAAASIGSVLRLRGEEAAGRTEAVLATPTSRWRWMGSCLAVALVTATLTMIAGGFGMGLATAAVLQDTGYIASLTAAGANNLVVPVVFAAAAALAYGVGGRWIPVVWAWFVASLLLTFFGPLLDLPSWTLNISAFGHVAQYPAEAVSLTPIGIMAGAAVLGMAGGLVAFRRRDLSSG